MKQAQHGDRVTIKYIGTLDTGRIFDTAPEDAPLVFTIGGGEVFPALENEVVGMCAGETKNFTIPAAHAFGPRRQENILKVERAGLPAGREPVVGEKMRIGFKGGVERVMLIVEVTDETVTLDSNHPLAGQDLTFALTLVAID